MNYSIRRGTTKRFYLQALIWGGNVFSSGHSFRTLCLFDG